MERLTEKVNGGYQLKIPKDKNISDLEIKFNAYDKLGAYEDAEELGLLVKLVPEKEVDAVFELDRVIEYCLDNVSNTEAGKAHLRLAEWLTELKEYQFLEEEGQLLRLPCNVGDIVYEISLVEPYRNPAIREMVVIDILLRDNDKYFTLQDLHDEYYDNSILSTEFGKTVFRTEEEAEAVLEKMKGAQAT